MSGVMCVNWSNSFFLFFCLFCFCVFVVGLRGLLEVYVCWKLQCFFFNFHMLTCEGHRHVYYLRLNSFMSLRLEKYARFIDFFFLFFLLFFNVVVQHLGPIDQSYALFGVFSIFEFRFHEIC